MPALPVQPERAADPMQASLGNGAVKQATITGELPGTDPDHLSSDELSATISTLRITMGHRRRLGK